MLTPIVNIGCAGYRSLDSLAGRVVFVADDSVDEHSNRRNKGAAEHHHRCYWRMRSEEVEEGKQARKKRRELLFLQIHRPVERAPSGGKPLDIRNSQR